MLSPQQVASLRTSAGLSPTAPTTSGADIIAQRKAALGLNSQPEQQPGYSFGPSNAATAVVSPTAALGNFLLSPKAPEVTSNLKNTFEQGGKNIVSGISNVPNEAQKAGGGPLATGLAAAAGAGHVAGDIAGTAGGILGSVISPFLPDSVKGAIGDASKFIADKVNAIPGMTPEIAKSLGDVFNSASLLGGAKAEPVVAEATPKVLDAAGSAVKPIVDKATTAIKGTPEMNAAKNNQFITSQYTKAIKPTLSGKSAPGQMEKYNANVGKAISTIVENKPNLSLVDQFGEPTGKLPQTIDQFRQAIEQSKASIFKQYDAMAKNAGESGAKVDLNPVARELQKVANNKVVQDLHPDLASYATSRAEALTKRGTYTTEEAQAATQNLNKSLEAFYRNPSYETASRASVDSLIANQLRTGLDKAIEGAGQAGYGDLKGKYSALKAIENDVTKRGIVEARQTGGRGLNVGDIVSAEELVRGLATMNPAAMTTSAAIKGLQALRRWYTDPNRAIKQMFERADATIQSPSSPTTLSTTGKLLPSQQSTTEVKKVK